MAKEKKIPQMRKELADDELGNVSGGRGENVVYTYMQCINPAVHRDTYYETRRGDYTGKTDYCPVCGQMTLTAVYTQTGGLI